MSEVISGAVVVPLEESETRKGTMAYSFGIKKGRRIISCSMYSHLLDRSCDTSQIKVGIHMALRGFWGKEQGEMFDPCDKSKFVVKWFQALKDIGDLKDIPKESPLEHWLKLCGGKAQVIEEKKKAEERAMRSGEVRVSRAGYGYYIPASDAIAFKGKYLTKIDYCMEVLGGEAVTEALQVFRKGEDLLMGKIKKEYKQVLEDLVQKAHAAIADDIPF